MTCLVVHCLPICSQPSCLGHLKNPGHLKDLTIEKIVAINRSGTGYNWRQFLCPHLSKGIIVDVELPIKIKKKYCNC